MMLLSRLKRNINACDICVFIILYFSHNTLLFGTNDNSQFALIHYAVIVLLFLYLWLTKSQNSFSSGKNIVITLTVLSFICMIVNMDFSLKYPFEVLSLWIALMIARKYSLNNFARSFVKVMAFLSIISLIVYGISFINYGLITRFPAISYISGKRFYTVFGLCNVMESYEYVFTRNFSVFREPGVFVIYLIIALLFTLKLESINHKKILLFSFVICILTTFSTAGYLILFMIFIYYFISNKKESTLSVILMLLAGIGIIYYVTTSGFITTLVFDKMGGDNSSYNARFGSIYTNINMWLDSIGSVFFGNGFEFVETNYALTSARLGIPSTDNTNTLLKILSVHGIFYFITYLTLVVKTMRIFDKRILANIILLVAFFALLSNEDMIFDQFLYVLFLYGFVYANTQIDELNVNYDV